MLCAQKPHVKDFSIPCHASYSAEMGPLNPYPMTWIGHTTSTPISIGKHIIFFPYKKGEKTHKQYCKWPPESARLFHPHKALIQFHNGSF